MASSLSGELLSLIFLYAHKEQYRDGTHVEDAVNKTAFEVTVTHVCSSWRANALALSRLWSTFQYIKNPDLPNTHVARFSAYLARSDIQLLDIRLDLRKGSTANHLSIAPDDRDRALLQAIIQQQARWKRFTILFNNMESAVEYEELLANASTPHLEQFTFCAMPVYHLRSRGDRRVSIPVGLTLHSPHYTFFNGAAAPMLQSVRLDASTFISNSLPQDAYSNLHTLRIDDNSDRMRHSPGVRLDKLKEVLKIPCLRNLSISEMRIEDPPGSIVGPLLTMKALKDFRCGSPTIVELLKHIDTPALKSMVLKRTPFPILRKTSVSSLRKVVLIACNNIPWARFSQDLSYITVGIEQLTVIEAARFVQESSHSSYFDYALELWPNLMYLGYHIGEDRYSLKDEPSLTFFISFAQKRAQKPLTLEIPSSLLDYWRAEAPQSLSSLRALCTLQRWEDGKPLIPLHWPYQDDEDMSFGHDLNDHDPFRLLWQNSAYVGHVPDPTTRN